MRHAGNAAFKVLWQSTVEANDRVREILNNAFDLWILSSYRNADLTMGAADVDNCPGSNGTEVEIVDEVVHAVG